MLDAIRTDAEAPASAVKDEMSEAFSVAAHDLRTPLAAISGLIELLLTEKPGRLNDEQRSLLSQAQVSTSRLSAYVSDALALNAVKARKFVVEDVPGRVQDCISELVPFWELAFKQRNVRIETEIDPHIPEFCFDAHKLQRVVSNLIDNALSHSPEGATVKIAVKPIFWERRHSATEHVPERRWQCCFDDNAVEIHVVDQGPGIPAKYRDLVFEEFFRIPGGNQRRGSGLGLAIAKNLVLVMGGRISILDNEVDHGSHFVVGIPYCR